MQDGRVVALAAAACTVLVAAGACVAKDAACLGALVGADVGAFVAGAAALVGCVELRLSGRAGGKHCRAGRAK